MQNGEPGQFQTLKDHIKLLRTQDAVDIVLILYIAFLLTGDNNTPTVQLVSVAVMFCFLLFFVHISNDISDRVTDKLNDLERPISSGRISVNTAKKISKVYLVAATIFALSAGLKIFILYLVTTALVWLYSDDKFLLSHRHFWGTAIIVLPYTVAPFMAGKIINANSFFPTFHEMSLLGSLILITASRILLKDFRDAQGDKQTNKITPLLLLGQRSLYRLVLFLFTSGAFLFSVFIYQQNSVSLGMLLLFITIALVTVLAVVYIFKNQNLQSNTKTVMYNQPRLLQFVYLLQRSWLLLIVIWLGNL